MPLTLDPIPLGQQITDQQGGITLFFRLRWEALRARFSLTPTVASVTTWNGSATLTAALASTALYLTLTAGLYRVTYFLRVTSPDGVSSAAQVTLGWTESGLALTKVGTNLTGDTSGSYDTQSVLVQVDAPTNITIKTTYASNTPNKMIYELFAIVEQIG